MRTKTVFFKKIQRHWLSVHAVRNCLKSRSQSSNFCIHHSQHFQHFLCAAEFYTQFFCLSSLILLLESQSINTFICQVNQDNQNCTSFLLISNQQCQALSVKTLVVSEPFIRFLGSVYSRPSSIISLCFREDNPGQNIWNKVKNSSKIRKEQKTL